MDWTDERVELLRKLWSEGVIAGEIADKLGISRNAVLGKANRLDLSSRRPGTIKGSKKRRKMHMAIKAKTTTPSISNQAPSDNPLDWVPFMASTSSTCRAIMGRSPQDGLILWCNNRKSTDESYCPYHLGIYYAPAKRLSVGQGNAR